MKPARRHLPHAPLIIALLALALPGCSASRLWYGSDKPRLNSIVVEAHLDKDNPEKRAVVARERGGQDESDTADKAIHIGTVISWSPEFNAAFVSSSGRGCIQPATYARLNSGNLTLPGQVIGASAGTLEGAYNQALEKLATVTDRSTFLSVGFYGICQLQSNDALDPAAVERTVLRLVDRATQIRDSAPADSPPAADAQASALR